MFLEYYMQSYNTLIKFDGNLFPGRCPRQTTKYIHMGLILSNDKQAASHDEAVHFVYWFSDSHVISEFKLLVCLTEWKGDPSKVDHSSSL